MKAKKGRFGSSPSSGRSSPKRSPTLGRLTLSANAPLCRRLVAQITIELVQVGDLGDRRQVGALGIADESFNESFLMGLAGVAVPGPKPECTLQSDEFITGLEAPLAKAA